MSKSTNVNVPSTMVRHATEGSGVFGFSSCSMRIGWPEFVISSATLEVSSEGRFGKQVASGVYHGLEGSDSSGVEFLIVEGVRPSLVVFAPTGSGDGFADSSVMPEHDFASEAGVTSTAAL